MPTTVTRAITSVRLVAQAGNSVSGSIIVVDELVEPLPNRANVVVFKEANGPTSRSALLPAPDNSSGLRKPHKDLASSPLVLVLKTDTTVYLLNDDRIFRNAFSLSKTKPFDLAIYPGATSKLVMFDPPRLVRLYCNIQPDKVSDILVLKEHLLFVTAGDDKYAIDRLPDGDSAVCVWAERAEETERPIRVTGVCL